MDNKQLKTNDTVELEMVPLFAKRDSIEEAMDFGVKMAEREKNPVINIVMFVLYNTIADNYHLVPKEKV